MTGLTGQHARGGLPRNRASGLFATFAGPGFEDLAAAKITAVMSLAWYRRATFVLGGA